MGPTGRKKQRPNPEDPKPDLLNTMLSIKVMNRISDKGQPWRSPTLTWNEFDLLTAMRTKLSHTGSEQPE